MRTDTSQIVLEPAEFVRVVDEVLEAPAHLCGPDDPAVALIECSRHLMEYEGDPPADLDERLDDRITGYLIDSQQEASCEFSGFVVGQGAEGQGFEIIECAIKGTGTAKAAVKKRKSINLTKAA